MTDLALEKAAKVLLNKDGILVEDKYLPKVWVVGNEICLFYNAARRHQSNLLALYNQYEKIEEVTIDDAYQFIHKRPLAVYIKKNVVQDFDQSGGFSESEKYNLAHNPVNDPRIQIKITD